MAAPAQRSGLTPLTEIAMTTRLDAARLRGIFPALPTPVRADDTVDADAARALMRHVLPAGIGGVVPLGGTGEYGALPRSERFHWLVAPRSAIIQTSPVHTGLCDGPQAMVEKLLSRLVR